MPAYSRILLPWDSQPQEGAGPNPDISQGLLSLILPNALSPINLAGSTKWEVQSGGVNGTGPAGRTLQTTATTDWWSTGIDGSLITAGCTVLCYYRKTDSTNRASSLFGTNLGGGTTFFNAHAPYSNGTTYWDFGGNTGANRISVAGLSYSRPTCLVFTAGASGMLIAQDGISRVSSSTAVSRTNGGDNVAFGRAAVVAADLNETYLFAIWNRQLPTHQALEISRDPFGQLFAPRSIWIPVSAGGGGISGTLATTNANDTSAASGTTTVLGTLARTNASDTSAASGTTTVLGASAVTNADDASAASGTVGTSGTTGTVAVTNANDTAVASGTTTVVGTVARTNADDSASAAGWVGTITGTVNVTNGDDTSDASGVAETGIVEQDNSGGWPIYRRKKKKDDDELEPAVIEAVAVVPAPRRMVTLEKLIGKKAAAQVNEAQLSSAIRMLKRKRQDEELMLM